MAGNTHDFTDANFQTDVLAADVPVLVDFWAPWCGPCRMLAPTVEALATEYSGKIRVGKVNTDENPKISMSYGIQSIPTLMLFKGGQVVNTMMGAQPKERIKGMLDQALA